MLLIGFVKEEHLRYLSSIHVNSKATGIAGIMGNKGGLQLSFKLYGKLFNFINVHLIHGAKRCEQRHEMMGELIKNLPLFREELDADTFADFAFILGDFNYRMNSTFTELVPKLDRILELKDNLDQLLVGMR